MPKIEFSQQDIPQSGKMLKEELSKSLQNASPLDDFIEVVRDLTQFEHQYKLDSTQFFERFQTGEMGDAVDFIRWANKYEIYQEIKAEFEHIFELLDQYALPVIA